MKKFSLLVALMFVAMVGLAATTSVEKPEGLTDLTSPTGAAVTSEDLLNGMSPQLAFNDSTSLTDTGKRFITNQKGSAVLVYTFDNSTAVNAIGIQNFNNSNCQNRSPKAWTFWGSNDFDGTRAGIATATWVKLDERSNETDWAKPEYRYYQFDNVKKFKSYKLDISDHNGGDNYIQIQKLEYFYVSQTGVQISGVPAECGDFSYDTIKPEVGSTVNLSAFDGEWTNASGNTKAVCVGYEVLVPNLETGEMDVLTSGTETSCSFTMPEAPVEVIWKFNRSFKVTAISAGNGAVSDVADWYAEGSVASPTLTPDSGYGFFKWQTDDSSICKFDGSFYVLKPISLTAVFAPVVELNPGECILSDAVNAAGDGNLILRLSAGDYTETNVTSCVVISKPIRIEGVGASVADVVVKRKANQSARIFYLDNADAVVKHLTISNGYGGGNVEPNSGGNVYITANGGTILDSVITGGNVNTYNSCGGNVRMLGGHLLRCVIQNGYTQTGYGAAGGGGVRAEGASIIENCLIKNNTVGGYNSNATAAPGGARLSGSSKMINCTLVGNGTTSAGYGAVYADGSSSVVNCAMFDNIARDDGTGTERHNQSWGGTQAAYVGCFSDVLVNGACFRTTTPAFTDASTGDYSLSVSSPLRDKGADYQTTGARSVFDLAGSDRISGTGVDVGAYEFVASGLSGDFTADKGGGITPCAVTFMATVEGATGAVSYEWDFDGDGMTDETTTTPSVTHTYEFGAFYTVGLIATDAGSGNTIEATHENMIHTCQKTVYVATDGTNEAPYTNPVSAATSIAAALNAAVDGCEILIASGDYEHSTEISVTKAVRIVGLGASPTNVYVHGKSSRAFYVDNADAVIANIEMYGSSSGSGKTLIINNAGGTVSNCVIHVGGGSSGWGAGGAAISGVKAFVTHCTIFGDGVSHLGDGWTRGGVVNFTSKSRIENSLIRDCAITYDLGNSGNGGNTMTLAGGSVAVNCTVVNCTNSTENSGGIYLDGTSYATNCVVYDVRNTTGSGSSTWYTGTVNNFVNCGNSEATSAAFVDYANGDYRPAEGGALVDSGVTPDGWAGITDLAGKKRVVRSAIDIGAYELQAPSQPKGVLIIYR